MKTKYRKSLEKQFKKQEPATNIYKLSEQPKHEFLSYAETPWTKEQKDLKKLQKIENKLIDALEEDTADGKKIKVKIPQRLQFLLDEGK